MKFRLKNPLSAQLTTIIRRAGYLHIFDQKSNKESFVRQLTKNRYPRFHLYVTETEKEIVFDLHLDQSKTRYEGQTAHNADYESDEVKGELTRIYQAVSGFVQK